MENLTILRSNKDLQDWQKDNNLGINFVPTMGGLHKGHQELIKSAKNYSEKQINTQVLLSIFVNPLQFGINEDFTKYPRNLDHDCELAYEAGANIIWAPSLEDIFPGGKESHFTIKAPLKLHKQLCGAYRENHFDGVATVVLRLLKLIKPKMLFLGEKDWQQLLVLRQLISDLDLEVKIKSIPTIREEDGLPFSSRNLYLSQQERANALLLPSLMAKASRDFKSNISIDLNQMKSYLEQNNLKVEYIETVNCKNLTKVNHRESKLCLLAAAIQSGSTRLIDHTFLMKRNPIVAIDGPAGAGKSTVTKAFAKQLGLIYLDTGAMYRAVTWFIQKENIDIGNHKDLVMALENINLDIHLSQSGAQHVLLNNEDITHEIRSPKITSQVSLIAANKEIRNKLTKQQQKLGQKGGLVAEGRDIGTAVFPDAELKVFLTASPKERAKRRAHDLKNQGFEVPNLLDLEEQIKERDKLDSTRAIAPLLKAKDAQELKTDGMNVDEVIETLISMFREEIPEEVWSTKTF
ncbi:bifunctional pantoate--beta-alanine ligase/(d)CMP kinase [Prochlorococcus marinus]|uniref:bifunctional pantoate--beta-alanine ligase/(d)CMP kinase n=1 Tax=Prochlorococcus marinus TaxID=1219 RepID=UPI0022B5021A|nr:bifunctional pantoate--beta-alanine ligase/(d)CMP kinase [Prochlorococcus marinus]